MFSRVPKYTQSLVKEISLPYKYYMTDIGMRNAVLMPQSIDEGKVLENIAFNRIASTLGGGERMTGFSSIMKIPNAISSLCVPDV